MTLIAVKGSRYERIARVAHEINRAYCEAIGDTSQVPWEDAPEWQIDSVIDGVDLVYRGTVSPEVSHTNWVANKVRDGWVYGEIKDPEKKTHPCMVPYEDLPLEQKVKDHLFVAVVRVLKEVL